VLKSKLETWDISTWKKTNWEISVLQRTRRMFAWTRDSWLKKTNFFMLLWTCY